MAVVAVNIGAAPNDGTGDPLRTAFGKINDSIADLVARTGPATPLGNVSGTLTVNAQSARNGVWTATLTGSATIALSNVPSGVLAVYTVQVRQDATGGRTLTMPPNTTMLNGVAAIDPTPLAYSLVTLATSDGGSTLRASIADARPATLDPLMWNPPADGTYYWRSPPPGCVLDLASVGKQGTGTLAFAKSLNATPTSFSTVTGATAFAAGDVLRVTVTGFSGWLAFDIPRTAP